jgi:excisionase family DNA binding protein
MADPIRGVPPSGEDPWLTVPEVAADLNIHPATVRVWIKAGRLAAVRAGRTWRVRRSDLERALLADASPALAHDGISIRSDTPVPTGRTPAPRQMADHILTITPAAGGPS